MKIHNVSKDLFYYCLLINLLHIHVYLFKWHKYFKIYYTCCMLCYLALHNIIQYTYTLKLIFIVI